MLFSGIFDLEPVVCAMWTVNLQKTRPEYVYLKKSCHYLKKLHLISCNSLYNQF